MKQFFRNVFSGIQRPKTAIGKNIRDAILFGLAAGLTSFLQALDLIDFGAYDAIVTSIVGFITVAINRVTRI